MASEFAPDGWSLEVGTWGTDADEDSTAVTGSSAIKFLPTATLTTLVSDLIPIEQGRWHELTSMVQCDNGAATLNLKVRHLNSSLAVVSTSTIASAVTVPSTGAWHRMGGSFLSASTSTIRWAQIVIEKASASSVSWYFDGTALRKLAPFFGLYLGSDQAGVATATWSTVEFDTDLFSGNNPFQNTTNGVQLRYGAIWSVAGHVEVQSVPQDTYAQLRVRKAGTTTVLEGPKIFNPNSSAQNIIVPISGKFSSAASNDITLEVYHNTGADRTLTGSYEKTQFTGELIGNGT